MRWMLLLLLFISTTARADTPAHITAFLEGRYVEAAALAQAETTPDRLAFAARSFLAEAMSADVYNPSAKLIDTAEQLAKRALDTEPAHIEGRLQLAIALSLRARALSSREAMRGGFGETTRDLAQSVLRDDPSNIYAHGFLAVWHLEVRRRGGTIGASIMGASVKKARRHYQLAIADAPDDASLHWQYARALAALNAKKYRQEIESGLDAAVACEIDSHLEHAMQARADYLLSELRTQKRAEIEALAARML
ncbi:MAG: hypothetical protein AAGA72_00530 [Pseudomonadota bacterium]